MNNPITEKLHADELIKMALAEDISNEDISTNAVMPDYKKGTVELICKQDGVICGLHVFARTFTLLDETTQIELYKKEGDEVKKGRLYACSADVLPLAMRRMLAADGIPLWAAVGRVLLPCHGRKLRNTAIIELF